MSERAHTPGPWHTHDDDVHAEYQRDGRLYHHWVASAAQPDLKPTPEQLANARLIAAAPDMYDALVALLAFYGDFKPGAPFLTPPDHPLTAARAAIARATEPAVSTTAESGE